MLEDNYIVKKSSILNASKVGLLFIDPPLLSMSVGVDTLHSYRCFGSTSWTVMDWSGTIRHRILNVITKF